MTDWIHRLFSIGRDHAVRGLWVALILFLMVDLASAKHPYFGIDGTPGFSAALAAVAGIACLAAARIWDALFLRDRESDEPLDREDKDG